jgi:hypothetical protein
MLRGIRYRSGRSLVVLLIAAFATLAAVLVPAYGRAAAQSVLTDGMRSAPITAASVTISAEGSAAGAAGGAFDPAQQPVAEAKALADSAFRRAPNLAAVLDRPISSVETDSQIALASGAKFGARLAWRLGSCGQLSINGSCAIDAEQVVISERSAKEADVKVGDFVTVRGARGDGEGRRLEVVGLYTPRNAMSIYWGNSTYFAHSALPGDGGLPRLDAVFTGSEDDVRLPGVGAISAKLTWPVRPGRHAGRCGRQDQRRNPRHARRAGIQEGVPRPILFSVDRRSARAARQVHQGRGAEVAQDHHRREHQGAVNSGRHARA